jgi:outer membrane murein-binding lipoprotein Lpp
MRKSTLLLCGLVLGMCLLAALTAHKLEQDRISQMAVYHDMATKVAQLQGEVQALRAIVLLGPPATKTVPDVSRAVCQNSNLDFTCTLTGWPTNTESEFLKTWSTVVQQDSKAKKQK